MSPNERSHLRPDFGEEVKRNHPMLDNLIEEASKVDGHTEHLDLAEEIPWLDYTQLEKGRRFVRENYAVIIMSLIITDTAGFVGKQIASVVFKNFYPSNTCGFRFISTFRTTMTWLLSDNYDQDSDFTKEMKRVRLLHKTHARPLQNNRAPPTIPPEGLTYPKEYTEIVEAIKKDLANVDTTDAPMNLITWSPSLYFSQFDVTLVQIGSLAPLLLYPHLIGISKGFEDNEGMQGYFHQWAVIGRMLGLKDKYNLALNPERDLYNDIIRRVGLPSLKNIDESVIFSIEKLTQQFSRLFLFPFTTKALLFAAINIHTPGNSLRTLFTFRDTLSYNILLVSAYLLRFKVFKVLANWGVMAALEINSRLYLK